MWHKLMIPIYLGVSLASTDGQRSAEPAGPDAMVLIKGSEFLMGDVFGEGREWERPTHLVRLSDFYLARHEVAVGAFRVFVEETGYETSAEQNRDWGELERLLAVIEKSTSREERADAERAALSLGGCWRFEPRTRSWSMEDDEADWRSPRFLQAENHPVTCVSWDDAIRYANWLSRRAGLQPAYDERTGELLDAEGRVTLNVSTVDGYRLPTEAEWEYAARERGRKLRFGNGRNVARAREINFDAGRGTNSYLERGEFRGRTVPIGSFEPNALGLFDMSGNVWEWCSDWFSPYAQSVTVNPHPAVGVRRVARGGRWGGSAAEARSTARFAWRPNNRCNNIGFRLARSSKARRR